jgi:hypothetical protein
MNKLNGVDSVLYMTCDHWAELGVVAVVPVEDPLSARQHRRVARQKWSPQKHAAGAQRTRYVDDHDKSNRFDESPMLAMPSRQ